MRILLILAVLTTSLSPATALPLCDPVAGCPAAIVADQYLGHSAYRLSDGHAVAVVVPSLGRIMHFGLVNGPNMLWNSRGPWAPGEWQNWGGDKMWLAPQSLWPLTTGQGWPPDSHWDGPQDAEVLTGGILRLRGALSKRTGTRIIREMSFNDAGEFVIRQVVRKETGAPLPISLWSITQVPFPDAVFLPSNPDSIYKNGYYRFKTPLSARAVVSPRPGLLRLTPSAVNSYKIGVDAGVAALVSVKGGVALVEKAAPPAGEFPDGAVAAGFPVEVFNSAAVRPADRYVELELLSPLVTAQAGEFYEHTVRWSLQPMPSTDPTSDAVLDAVTALLK